MLVIGDGRAAVVTAVCVGPGEGELAPSVELGDDPVIRSDVAVARIEHAGRVRVRDVDVAGLSVIAHERNVVSLGAEIERELGLRREARHELVGGDRNSRDVMTPWRQLVEDHRGGDAEERVDAVVVEDRREVVAVGDRSSTAADRSGGAAGRQLRDPGGDIGRSVVARAHQQVARHELRASAAVVPPVRLRRCRRDAHRERASQAHQHSTRARRRAPRTLPCTPHERVLLAVIGRARPGAGPGT